MVEVVLELRLKGQQIYIQYIAHKKDPVWGILFFDLMADYCIGIFYKLLSS